MISIIIRTKNEERWIGRCLRMLFKQEHKDFEVILVDNCSTDHTLAIAKRFPIKILTLDEFKPGLAINLGIRASVGDYIVCLSAHCIPRDRNWLGALFRNFQLDPAIVGVYGRQLPFLYSSDYDKRDLLITFGLDHRIQLKDHFFHNANSMIRRDVWKKIPFDEAATNIEDRIWGKEIINAGYKIAYEPDAAVYHFHGIHQDRDANRAKSIVRIMESLDQIDHEDYIPEGFKPESLTLLNIMPIQGAAISLVGVDLIERALQSVQKCKYPLRTVVLTDDERVMSLCRGRDVMVIRRDNSVNLPDVGLEEVLKYALETVEAKGDFFDAVMYINYLYPFRPIDFFETLISKFCLTGADTVLSSQPDYLPYWAGENGKLVSRDTAFRPRNSQNPTQKGLAGLGLITSSEFIRRGVVLGDKVALMPLKNPLHALKAGEPFANKILSIALENGPEIFGVEQ